jgi:hypothetical protein
MARYTLSVNKQQLSAERDAIQREIAAAFANVSREGGVSWSEAVVIDDYGTDQERAAARASDTDSHWSELVEHPEWIEPTGSGGFNFLDPLGFRYYLAAAMMQIVRGQDDSQWIAWHLTMSRKSESRDFLLKQWSLLDAAQRRCVRRFLRFMAAWDETKHAGWGTDWQKALDLYWESQG